VKITIGIKALNEEQHIGAALESALAAVAPFSGEVVLADSGSTDRTLEIARRYPVRIVQLANIAERSCGAGAQLAFEHARGTYFYLLDGDMLLDPGFLAKAIDYLDAHPDIAAVGGMMREMNTDAEEFQIRAAAIGQNRQWQPGYVDQLDCGGLYRMSAVREVGWFADRNLHAFEEFELGARLGARGWKLARIAERSVDHYGHQMDGYTLLLRRLKSGYLGAPGEVLRGALGAPHLPLVVRRLSHVRVAILVMLWWVLLAVLIAAGAFRTIVALLVLPYLFLAWRRRSLRLGLFSFVSWNLAAFAFVGGFFRRRIPPASGLAAHTLQEPLPNATDAR
jgi:glycosyltransferase involved in cell wall biosynthesis